MSDFEELHITWRKPKECDLSKTSGPSVEISALEAVEASLTYAASKGERIRPVFDINQTLGTFEKNGFHFYPGVLPELIKLLKTTPVVLISGDQTEVITRKVIPTLQQYIHQTHFPDEALSILQNLTVYAQTGMKKITFLANGTIDCRAIQAAELTKDEFTVIKEDIIPRIRKEFCNDPGFSLLAKEGFGTPNTDENAASSHPLYMQEPPHGGTESIELSVFGVRVGEDRKRFQRFCAQYPELADLRDKIIDRCNELLTEKNLRLHAQLGGTTTVDFRKFDKAQVMYLHIGDDVAWNYFTALIGVGDSFASKGNDRPLIDCCGITYDVSEQHENARNAHAIIQLINRYSNLEE